MANVRLKWLLLASTSVASIAACADLFGLKSATTDGDASAPDTGGPDAPFDGGNVDTDANSADCGAGARTIAEDAGLFVTQTGSGSACTMAAPCGSIAAALAIAQSGQTIYVAPGTYTETLEIGSSIQSTTIEGGWTVTDAGWVPQCDNTVATIQRNPANPAEWAIHANNGKPLTLRLVKIVNDAPPQAAAGTSVYGVLANNTPVTLDNVLVAVGDAVPGAGGDPGIGDVAYGCAFPPPPSNGAKGADGDAGAPGSIVPTPTGFDSLTKQAANGAPAAHGENGTGPGSAPACLNCVTCQMTCGLDGGVDSGSNTTCSVHAAPPACPTAGQAGCGGGGGFGGWAAGHGFGNKALNGNGGSSVAVYVWQNTLTFTNTVTLRAGNASGGGKGGDGVLGASGTPGMPGNSASCNTTATCDMTATCPNSFQCAMNSIYTQNTAPGGAAGGDGGPGGTGGQGGGGAGGFSYGYYSGGNATIQGAPSNVQFGQLGTGGLPNGPNGASAQHN